MKIKVIDLARVLAAETRVFNLRGAKFDELPYHRQLSFVVEAKKVIRALKRLQVEDVKC